MMHASSGSARLQPLAPAVDLLPRPIFGPAGRGAMLLLPLLLGGLAACSSATVEENHGELCKVTLQLSEEYHRLEQELAIARQSLSALDVVVTRWGPPRLFPGGRIYVVGHHLGGEEGQVPR
ncbi:MAG: hypothetical protein FJ125_09110, partial [Deltaproteobacteria bacterium]|nr:hypothetical protein [Deltaproteobacteria bacterium]